jgi:hypothetical protein
MADIQSKGTKTGRSFIAEDLQRRINEFQGGKEIINGALVIDSAHAYWWYLEFGTASRYAGVEGTGLVKPPGIASDQGRTGEYRIDRAPQTGTDSKGRIYKKKLRFRYLGAVIFREYVMHPGARPAGRGKGVVRVGIRQAQLSISNKLRGYKRRTKSRLPYRYELVAALNEVLAELLNDVKRLTPRGEHDDNSLTPLKDAWTIRKAK